ncbi:Nucleoprotein, partial [Frankliniella fusca]
VKLSKETTAFWTGLEGDQAAVGWHLPENFKLLLEFHGYNSQFSVATLTEEDLQEIEEDARTRFQSQAERKGYLGNQASNPANFKIFRGFRKTILAAASICKSKKFLGKAIASKSTPRRNTSTLESSQDSLSSQALSSQSEERPGSATTPNQNTKIAAVIRRLVLSGLKAAAGDVSEAIQKAAANVTVNVENSKRADIICPIQDCCKVIPVAVPDDRNSWVVSNFTSHAKSMHPSAAVLERKEKKKRESRERKRPASTPNPIMAAFSKHARTPHGASRDAHEELGSADEDDPGEDEHQNRTTRPRSSANGHESDGADGDGADGDGADANDLSARLLDGLDSDTFTENFANGEVQPGQRMTPHYVDLAAAVRPENDAPEEALARPAPGPAPAQPVLPAECGTLLERMLETLKRNQGRHKNAYRFETEDKLFFTYLFIQGGRKLYETLHANAPKSMPSLSTILKYQGKVMEPVREGQCRWQELSEYLEDNHLPRVIAISEDGTRITGQIEYDSTTNLLVGFSPPLDRDGCPDTSHFEATGERAMRAMFDEAPRAHTAYVLMAQPLQDGAAPFCLMAFGTDNRFGAEDGVRRWRWLKRCAEIYGIAIISISTDGDPKMLRGMRFATRPMSPEPDNPQEWKGFFDQDLDTEVCYVQDTVHIGTKFRTGFCHKGKTYVMGTHCASVAHLEHLLATTSRMKHLLRDTDLNHADKMNFAAVLRITDERVLSLLRGKGMEQYAATELFLTLVRGVLVAFLDDELTAEERIFQIWRSTFFFRIWREWLVQNEHSLEQCFITPNTFQSVELNAHALVKLVRIFRDSDHAEQFIPHLIGSQQCEKLFRALRSLTTTHATVINFSMLKMLARLRRVELQIRVVSAAGDTFSFPREEEKRVKAGQAAALRSVRTDWSGGLPSDGDILFQIGLARSEAKDCAALLGMDPDIMEETIPAPLYGQRALDLDLDVDDAEDAAVEEVVDSPPPEDAGADFDPDDVALICARQAWSAGQEVRPFPPESPMMLYTTPNGVKVPIRKTTFCWLGNRGSTRLSSDRLLRVQLRDTSSAARPDHQRQGGVVRRESIASGEWCTFKKTGEARLRVGRVLSFRYATGDGRKRLYTLPTAPVAVPDGVEARGLCVLYSWFDVDRERAIAHISTEECAIETYMFSIPSPEMKNGALHLSEDVVTLL